MWSNRLPEGWISLAVMINCMNSSSRSHSSGKHSSGCGVGTDRPPSLPPQHSQIIFDTRLPSFSSLHSHIKPHPPPHLLAKILLPEPFSRELPRPSTPYLTADTSPHEGLLQREDGGFYAPLFRDCVVELLPHDMWWHKHHVDLRNVAGGGAAACGGDGGVCLRHAVLEHADV
jgi:hypothetical protein